MWLTNASSSSGLFMTSTDIGGPRWHADLMDVALAKRQRGSGWGYHATGLKQAGQHHWISTRALGNSRPMPKIWHPLCPDKCCWRQSHWTDQPATHAIALIPSSETQVAFVMRYTDQTSTCTRPREVHRAWQDSRIHHKSRQHSKMPVVAPTGDAISLQ